MSLKNKFFKYLEKLNYHSVLKNLVSHGLKINIVYDIGAHKGRWTKQHASLLPNANFYLFEANKEHAEKLKSRGYRTFIGVLSSDGEPAKFYKKAGTGDSLYRENTPAYSEDSFEVVTTRTLSQVAISENLPKPDFIKLDVQGAEIDILKGAGELLDSCSLLLAECPIVPYNLGAPELNEYLTYFKSKGFSPLRITEQHSNKGSLLQIDILFLKNSVRKKLFGNI
jgi:FkbM family methyltransferase